VAVLSRWIDQGARWPRSLTIDRYDVTTDRWAGRDWWSLQPITRPISPSAASSRSTGPVDRFIEARLAKHGLEPNPPATRRTFL